MVFEMGLRIYLCLSLEIQNIIRFYGWLTSHMMALKVYVDFGLDSIKSAPFTPHGKHSFAKKIRENKKKKKKQNYLRAGSHPPSSPSKKTHNDSSNRCLFIRIRNKRSKLSYLMIFKVILYVTYNKINNNLCIKWKVAAEKEMNKK